MLQPSPVKPIYIALVSFVFVILFAIRQTGDGSLTGSLRQRALGSAETAVYPNEANHASSVAEDAILQRYETVPNNHIWKLYNISESAPFIFMHQRKAGGSSLRLTLHAAAKSLHLTSFIPCFGGVGCSIFRMPATTPYAIYGIHTDWGGMEGLVNKTISVRAKSSVPPAQLLTNTSTVSTTGQISCMTNFREPVSRLISCLYYRFQPYFTERHLHCINDLSVERMTKLLVEHLDIWGNSCLNEPYRVFGPISDERLVTSLGYDYNNVTYEVKARYGELEQTTLNTTLHNLQRCVPIVLEIPQSRRLLKVAFPALYANNAFDEEVHRNLAPTFIENCTAPSAAHSKVIQELTSFESGVYRAVVKKVHSALKEFHMDGPYSHHH